MLHPPSILWRNDLWLICFTAALCVKFYQQSRNQLDVFVGKGQRCPVVKSTIIRADADGKMPRKHIFTANDIIWRYSNRKMDVDVTERFQFCGNKLTNLSVLTSQFHKNQGYKTKRLWNEDELIHKDTFVRLCAELVPPVCLRLRLLISSAANTN